MSVLKVGNLCAKKGQKISGLYKVCNTDIKLPVTLINGNKSGKTVCISAGVHGSEYNGIETINRLAQSIEPNETSGKIIFIHVVI